MYREIQVMPGQFERNYHNTGAEDGGVEEEIQGQRFLYEHM